MFADLHIHSRCSDGTLTPEHVARQALEAGVGIAAITDHNILDGSRALLSQDLPGLRRLSGVELDVLDGSGRHLHLLGYGMDLGNAGLNALAKEAREALDGMSPILMERMGAHYPVSVSEYEAFDQPWIGGWKALHYLVHKGIAATLAQAAGFYGRYQVAYADAPFPSLADACRAVRGAGGRAVLAHPGQSLPTSDEAAFVSTLEALFDQGVQGLEAYHPAHSPQLAALLARLCHERGMLCTGGSDCHGAFGNTRIGEQRLPAGRLRLDGLV